MNIFQKRLTAFLSILITMASSGYLLSQINVNADEEIPDNYYSYDIDGDKKITVKDLIAIRNELLNDNYNTTADNNFNIFDFITVKNILVKYDETESMTTTTLTSETFLETQATTSITSVPQTSLETQATTSTTSVPQTSLETQATTSITSAPETSLETQTTTSPETSHEIEISTTSLPETTSEMTTFSETTSYSETSENIIMTNEIKTEENGLIYGLAQHQAYSPTPSSGNIKSCVIMIEFADVEFADDCSPEQVQNLLFGDGESYFYPYDSLSDYYERASYGRINIDGDVYKTKVNTDFEADADNTAIINTLSEALESIDNDVDFSQYDNDNDGIIDHILFIPAMPSDSSAEWGQSWWSSTISVTGSTSLSFDGKEFETMIIDHYQPSGTQITQKFLFLNTAIHETGHSMGLQDYYCYDDSTQTSFSGSAGFEIMGTSTGDFSAFSKLMLGWYTPDEVQVFDDKISSYYLSDSSAYPSCLILPVGNLSTKLASEYFVVEYVTNDNNNKNVTNESGIRIWHAEAEVKKYPNIGNLWIYNNIYSSSSKDLLRLVNDGNGFFNTDDIISSETISDFLAYNDSGELAAETGYTIKIGELINGKYKITVTKNT